MVSKTLSQIAKSVLRIPVQAVWRSFISISGLGVLFDAWSSSSELMKQLLNVPRHEADEWMKRWQEQKSTELQFVSVTSALIATTISASFAWKNVEQGPAATVACWYSSLLMAVISITSATQQSNTLRKLTCYIDGFEKLRQILRSDQPAPNGQYTESRLQHFIWQTPIMLLNISIIIYVVGLLVLIFDAAVAAGGGAGAKESRIAIVFGIAVVYSIGSHLISMLSLYYKARKIRLRQNAIDPDQ